MPASISSSAVPVRVRLMVNREESSRFFISEEYITFPDSTFAEHARPSAHEAFGFMSGTTGFSPSLAVNKKKVSKK